MEASVRPQADAWAHGVRILGKISKRHPQSEFYGLGISLQFEWQYLQRTVPIVGIMMVPIEETLRETLVPTLFGGVEVDTDFRKTLGHSVNRGGLGITDPLPSEESVYDTSNSASGELVGTILGGTGLNYEGHRACIRRSTAGARKERYYS